MMAASREHPISVRGMSAREIKASLPEDEGIPNGRDLAPKRAAGDSVGRVLSFLHDSETPAHFWTRFPRKHTRHTQAHRPCSVRFCILLKTSRYVKRLIASRRPSCARVSGSIYSKLGLHVRTHYSVRSLCSKGESSRRMRCSASADLGLIEHLNGAWWLERQAYCQQALYNIE